MKILDFLTINRKSRLIVSYNSNKTEMSTCDFKKVSFGTLLGKIHYDYIYSVGQKLNRRNRIVEIIDRKKEQKETKNGKKCYRWYLIKCQNCDSEHWLVESQLSNNGGCPYCIENSHKVKQGVNDIVTTDSWMIPFFSSGEEEASKYKSKSHHKIYPKCPVCGKKQTHQVRIADIYRRGRCGCLCENTMSFSESVVRNILEENNISYIKEASKTVLPWALRSRYDFYLPDFNMIIETHGIQHYKETPLKARTLQEEQRNDEMKKEKALANGIKYYYEINCACPTVQGIVSQCESNGLFKILNIDAKQLEFTKLKNNILKDEIEKCETILKDNPNIRFSQLLKALNLKHSYDLQRILDILNIKVPNNRMPIYVYEGDKLIAKYKSKSEFCRDRSKPYNLKCINTLNKYIDNGKILNGKYTYQSASIDSNGNAYSAAYVEG